MSLIIDIGCYQTKIGLSEHSAPNIIPTIINDGNVEYLLNSYGQLESDKLEQFLENKSEIIDEYPIVWSANPLWEMKSAHQIKEVLFEKFRIPSLKIVDQPELIMIENGRTNGSVFNSGHGNSYAVVIRDGKAVEETLVKSELGGRFLSECLGNDILENRGVNMNQSIEFSKSLTNLKENLEESFELPDKSSLTVGMERFKSCEELFSPKIIETIGFPELIINSIDKLDMEWRRDIYSNVVLAGGTTMIPRFMDRLKNDLKNMIPTATPLNVRGNSNRIYSAWRGGKLLSNMKETKFGINTSLQEYLEK